MNDMSNDQLVLIGDHHESIPVLLVADPDLSSNDKILWQVLRISIQRNQGHITMPAQSDMATMMGITKKTVIASLNTLRVTRWLSVQHQFDEAGRQIRNIYAIHTRPASLSDAIALDDHYPVLLRKCANEGQGRTSHLAEQALNDLHTNSPFSPSRLLADQDEYDAALEAYGKAAPISSEVRHPVSFFGRTRVRFGTNAVPADFRKNATNPPNCEIGHTVASLDSGGKTAKNGVNTRGVKITPHKNPKNGANIRGVKITPLENTGGVIFTPRSSSNYKKITTTTTDTEINIDTNEELYKGLLTLSEKEKRSLWIYLEKIPAIERQAFWDEFTGTVVRKTETAFPILNKVTYFRGMVKKWQNGEFHYTGESGRVAERRGNQATLKATEKASKQAVLERAAKQVPPGKESALCRKVSQLAEKYSKRNTRDE